VVGWSTFGQNDLAQIGGDSENVILRCAQDHLKVCPLIYKIFHQTQTQEIKHTEEKFRALAALRHNILD
jgi:hypothetical protein